MSNPIIQESTYTINWLVISLHDVNCYVAADTCGLICDRSTGNKHRMYMPPLLTSMHEKTTENCFERVTLILVGEPAGLNVEMFINTAWPRKYFWNLIKTHTVNTKLIEVYTLHYIIHV